MTRVPKLGVWFALFFALAACLPAAGAAAANVLEQGLARLNEGKWVEARSLLARAAKASPGDARAWLGLAHACLKLDRKTEADAAVEKALKLSPKAPAVIRGAAMYYANAGRREQAASLEERFAALVPADRDALPRAASFYLDAGKPEKAAQLAEKALEQDKRASVHALYAKALEEAKRPADAETAWRATIAADRYEEGYYVDFAQFLLRQQKPDEALAILADGRKVFDRSGRIELTAGVAYYAQRRFPEAVTQFLKAMDFSPGMPQPYVFLGRILNQAGDRMPEIVHRYEALVKASPDAYQSHFLLGKALMAGLPPTGYPEPAQRAEQELKQSIALKADFWEAHHQLGLLLERKRDLAAAEASFRRATELNPDSAASHYQLSRVLARLGRADEAEAERKLHQTLTEQQRSRMEGMASPEIGDVTIR